MKWNAQLHTRYSPFRGRWKLLNYFLGSNKSNINQIRNAEWNGNRNPEWWGDFSQLQIQIKPKFQFQFVPQDISEFKSNQNLNSTLYREIPRNLIFSILTSWPKSPHHSGFRLPFNAAFRVSTSTKRAVRVNIDGKSSMGQFSYSKPENRVIAHKSPTK